MQRSKGFLILVVVGIFLLHFLPVLSFAKVDPSLVPDYVYKGLQEYETRGYEAAVTTWFANSPYENSVTLASNIAFFRNIEKLAGKYLSYDILMTKETISSNVIYVRMNFERMPGYILFTSIKREKGWVLGNIKLDRMQRFGSAQ